MAKKPKAYRLTRFAHSEILRESGLFIPDGATVPLPASVRRIVRLVMREYRKAKAKGDLQWLRDGPQGDLLKACDAYERATKAKGRKS